MSYKDETYHGLRRTQSKYGFNYLEKKILKITAKQYFVYSGKCKGLQSSTSDQTISFVKPHIHIQVQIQDIEKKKMVSKLCTPILIQTNCSFSILIFINLILFLDLILYLYEKVHHLLTCYIK